MEQENDNGYVVGMIGAIIGAVVGAIPWLVVYFKFNIISAYLNFLIPFCSFKGYQIAKGKMNRKIIAIISILSIFITVVFQMLVTPLIMLYHEGFTVSLQSVAFLYQLPDFKSGIIHDLLIAILFTIFGISYVAQKIMALINQGHDLSTAKLNDASPIENEQLAALKEAFETLHATDKNSTISKEELMVQMQDQFDSMSFQRLKTMQIIRKYKGNYYYCNKAEQSILYRFYLLYGRVLIVVVIILLIVTIAATLL